MGLRDHTSHDDAINTLLISLRRRSGSSTPYNDLTHIGDRHPIFNPYYREIHVFICPIEGIDENDEGGLNSDPISHSVSQMRADASGNLKKIIAYLLTIHVHALGCLN